MMKFWPLQQLYTLNYCEVIGGVMTPPYEKVLMQAIIYLYISIPHRVKKKRL